MKTITIAAGAAALLLLAGMAYAGAAPGAGAREARRMDEARGRFEVEVKPVSAPGAAVTRMTLSKRWSGDVEGTSEGEMLSYGSPASGNAGYVAIERVTGSVKGRAGSFALQQSGVMEGGAPTMTVTVTPGSGTGALAGISGTMTIDAAAGHAYVLRYALPGV